MNKYPRDLMDAMLTHMPIGVAMYDAQSLRLIDANERFHTFLNPHWRNGRAMGHVITDWFPERERNEAVEILRAVAETEIPYHTDAYEVRTIDRGITYWDVTITPMRNKQGRVVQLLQVINEVTAQVVARQQAEHNHDLLRKANLELENERKRLEIIETIASSVRESLETLCIGKAVTETLHAKFDILNVYIHIADATKRVLNLLEIPGIDLGRKKYHLQTVPYDSEFLTAQAHQSRQPIIVEDAKTAIAQGLVSDKHPLLSEQLKAFICVPLWYRDHFEGTLMAVFKHTISACGLEVQTFVGCGTHIASALAHARLHAIAEHEHARLLSILDQLPEGVMIVEAADRRISYANIASSQIYGIGNTVLSGTTPEEHLLAKVTTHLNGQAIQSDDFPLNRALRGEYISGRETLVTRPDGKQIVLLTSAAPLKDANGAITGAVSVFQDITVRKSIEQQKNMFLSVASHELRTPITAILGFAEILQMQIARGTSLDTPRSGRAITGITEQSQRLTRLIESMLDLSRLEKAQLFVNLAEHDLLAIIQHVLETQIITNKNHLIRFTLEGLKPTDRLMICIDEDRIDQVLNNLIGNAIKYSPLNSMIEVGLRYVPDSPDEALIWVKDQGIGIAANELPSIFERFHRASNLDRSISGLGIGLYLVKELVTRHGGRVWVESVEGQGSTFYVSLPLNLAQAER